MRATVAQMHRLHTRDDPARQPREEAPVIPQELLERCGRAIHRQIDEMRHGRIAGEQVWLDSAAIAQQLA